MEYEISSILMSYLSRLQDGREIEMPLRDSNGNTVGQARLERRK